MEPPRTCAAQAVLYRHSAEDTRVAPGDVRAARTTPRPSLTTPSSDPLIGRGQADRGPHSLKMRPCAVIHRGFAGDPHSRPSHDKPEPNAR